MALSGQKSVDLNLTDIVIPEQDGFQTIVILSEEFPNIYLVAMSGNAMSGNRIQRALKQLEVRAARDAAESERDGTSIRCCTDFADGRVRRPNGDAPV